MGVFNSLTLLLVLAVSSALLQGCGNLHRKAERAEIVQNPTISLNPPVKYDLFDDGCQKLHNSFNLDSGYIHGWQGFAIADTLKNFDATHTSKTSLESNIISDTYYDRHFQRECDSGNDSSFGCFNKQGEPQTYQHQNDENFLRICRDGFVYPRETYESVALTSIYYINEAARVYERAYHQRLPKIRLDILPRFETRIKGFVGGDGMKRDVSSWLTNNLAYFPKSNLIAVFPENETKAKSASDHFWESAFVLSHELGHHIEKQFVGSQLKEIGLSWDGSEHHFKAMTSDASGTSRAALLGIMYDSVSEGYADLKAFYAVNESSDTVANIACMGKNRDLNNALFADGHTAKRLSLDVVKTLYGSKQTSQVCGEINYSDAHIVGAVIAYAMDQILNDLIAGQRLDPQARIDEKYRLIDEWYQALITAEKSGRSRSLAPEQVFQTFSVAIEQTVSTYAKQLMKSGAQDVTLEAAKARICRTSQRLLPVVNPAPFGDTHSCPSLKGELY